jgi:hypothetical protein
VGDHPTGERGDLAVHLLAGERAGRPGDAGGEHTGTLRFTSPEAFNDPIDLAVTLDIVE